MNTPSSNAYSLGLCPSQDKMSSIFVVEPLIKSLHPIPTLILSSSQSPPSSRDTNACKTTTSTATISINAKILDHVTCLPPHDMKSRSQSISKAAPLTSYSHDGTKLYINPTMVSREGHDKERYERCPFSNRLIRLVTGCIPITRDGKILLMSSKKKDKKDEWGLPKGGWEIDEVLEESAVRETYEEAGVVGVLGDRMEEVTFETRKGKKQRLKLEMESGKNFESQASIESTVSEIEHNTIEFSTFPQIKNTVESLHLSNIVSCVQEQDTPSIVSSNSSQQSLTTNVDGTTSKTMKRSHGLCRMVLFPLYVTQILEEFPEQGRARKIVTIDDAIRLVKRDFFRDALLEIKKSSIHLKKPGVDMVS